MKATKWPLDPELEALLERARIIPRVRDPVRTRVLARARAAMMAVGPVSPARPGPTQRLRIAMAAASVAMAVGVAVAATAHHQGGLQDRRQTTLPSPLRWQAPPGRLPLGSAPDDTGASTASAPTSLPQDPQPRTRSVAPQDSDAAELALLRRAQIVYASGDFRATLTLVTKHAARFPNGRLSEEGEALRVHALAGLGRIEEARRATAGFTHRFPRSVLSTSIQQTAE